MSARSALVSFAAIYVSLLVMAILAFMLPGMAVQPLSFFQALFLAVSATSLTGMSITDFPGDFTMAGQWTMLFIIQVSAFFLLTAMIYHVALLRNEGAGRKTNLGQSIRKAGFYLFSLELLSSISIYAFMKADIPAGEKLFYAIFTGVSAVCQAGFLPFNDSLANQLLQYDFLLHLLLAGILLVSSLGYFVLEDLLSIGRLRGRMLHPEKGWNRHTSMVINTAFILLVVGGLLFYFSEFRAALQKEKLVEAGICSLLNVAGAKTAGFYNISPASLSNTVLSFFMVLMLTGTAFGSTGGGLRPMTFAALFQKNARARAANILLFGFSFMVVGWLLLLAQEPSVNGFVAFFMPVSAFTNTGIVLTPVKSLSNAGQWTLMIEMLAGRMMIPALACLYVRWQNG